NRLFLKLVILFLSIIFIIVIALFSILFFISLLEVNVDSFDPVRISLMLFPELPSLFLVFVDLDIVHNHIMFSGFWNFLSLTKSGLKVTVDGEKRNQDFTLTEADCPGFRIPRGGRMRKSWLLVHLTLTAHLCWL